MTNSEHIERLDRYLHNRTGDAPCAFHVLHRAEAPGDFSLIEAIRVVERTAIQQDPEEKDRSIHPSIGKSLVHAKLLAESQPCPILAVSGLLNAGKTSLVAGFLSRDGQSRLLVGSANQQGTHRFVLWLPDAWRRHDELWSAALQQLQTIFGIQPEELATDPSRAFRQYNGECFLESSASSADPMRIPLVASDAALDRWGIGLMDCPDIQTGIVDGSRSMPSPEQTATEAIEAIAASRASMLHQALKIASAFVVVTSANSIQDQSVSAILEAAAEARPGLKRILAINRVPRRYRTEEIADEIQAGYREYSLWRVYMAYHFEGPHERHRIPPLPGSQDVADPARPWPVFFRIDGPRPVQPPSEVPASDFLVALGSQLDRSQLVREMLQSTLASLAQQCRQAWSKVEAYAVECQQRIQRVHRILAAAALELSMSDPSSPGEHANTSVRLQVSREIVGQIAESLERTAPWWAIPSRRLIRWSDQLRQLAGGVTQWVALPSWISDRASATSDWVRRRWRSGDGGRIISATSYGESIRNHDRMDDLRLASAGPIAPERLQQIERIIERFHAESRTRLKDSQLDAYTRETWKRMTWRQRLWTGIAPAGLLFAPLLAVVMVPLDFGGTTVLVCASMKELLFAGMASVGMAMINSDHMPQIAEQEAAWQQLSDLFAITCDGLGVPRPTSNGQPELKLGPSPKKLLESSLPVLIAGPAAETPVLLDIYPEFAGRLDRALNELLSSTSQHGKERIA